MGKKSGAWDFFRVDPTSKLKKAICNECGVVVSTCGNTTNLHRHLKNNHLSLFNRTLGKKVNKVVVSANAEASNADSEPTPSTSADGTTRKLVNGVYNLISIFK